MDLKEELKAKLREIFHFESQDLDFGIYRIMNYKRKKIERFIEEELINKIREQLQLVSEEEKQEIEQKLKEMSSKNGVKKYLEALEKRDEGRIKIYKEDFAKDIEEYERLKRQFEEIKITEDLEKNIYNHLINFFSRYYEEGDFINKRRFGKNEKYVIPYNGEKVLLHWATKEQYYIKTTEYFARYTFKVRTLTVNFRVISAEEEKANIKSPEKKFFVLANKIFEFDKDKNELNIYFEYRGLTEEEEKKYQHGNSVSQDKVNEEIINILNEKLPQNSPARFIFEKSGEKTYIEKHLYRYTRRNTTDYFIHKDLKNFLERELDFYIKNEFLQLEDLQILEESGYFDKLRLYLIGVRAFRNIALKIIEFLAQIENFQKKLWEKKKFVIDTHYVITLDKIKEYAGEEFLESILDEVLKNKEQLEEWKELFDLEVKTKEDLITNTTLQGKEWKKLPIDTRYFSEDFKWRLLEALTQNNDLDDILDGILIKSENFQALNLLLNKYKEEIKTIYIDPPYNTGSDGFLYKDNYQRSSWLTMMENRLSLAKDLLREDGVIFVSIDDNEISNLDKLMKLIFGDINFVANLIRISTKRYKGDVKNVDTIHDYVLTFAKSLTTTSLKERKYDDSIYTEEDEYVRERGKYLLRPLDNSTINYSPQLDYEINAPDGTKIVAGGDYSKYLLRKEGKYKKKDWCFRWSKEKFEWGLKNGLIVFKKDQNNKWRVYFKIYQYVDNELNPRHPFKQPNTLLDGFYNNQGTSEIKNLNLVYSYPKPVSLIYYLINISSINDSCILDFFAGSGTTAHAVMKLNKEDRGKRKFILVEMADYFYTVIIPRIKKVAYSFNWKEGKPQDMDGIGVFFKYHTLEQYEDALENIEFEKPNPGLYELPDYFVKYMLEWETKNSNTFLNLEKLKDPFNYKLKVYENYQIKETNADVVETFNYLLGIKVNKYKTLEDNGRRYLFTFGEKAGRKIAIVWRNINNLDFEKDREIIEENIKLFEPEEIYINGDAIVRGFKPIEHIFKSLMFEREGNHE